MNRILFFWIFMTLAGCVEKKQSSFFSARHDKCIEPGTDYIYRIAHQEIISKKTQGNIWNLTDIDISDIEVLKGQFSNSDEVEFLAVCGGEAGLSSGDADNLILKISCDKNTGQFSVDWAAQGSKIKQENVKDLDKDGLDEIIQTNTYTWMGECGETIHIFNLKNNKQNTLYKTTVRSVIDCGGSFAEYSRAGDTLATEIKVELKDTDNDGIFELIEKTKYLIHNGGRTEEEIIAGLVSEEKNNLLTLKNGVYSSPLTR